MSSSGKPRATRSLQAGGSGEDQMQDMTSGEGERSSNPDRAPRDGSTPLFRSSDGELINSGWLDSEAGGYEVLDARKSNARRPDPMSPVLDHVRLLCLF